ncbi:hypothetical protein KTH46_19015 [Acinetobacter bereziniae]|uniref:hypothetical protein n=1 Tax=Acinetobacter bereziniae TaxID=106648 RepID=UPI0021D0E840|nr:hypothetical protein [Acinetobacter bereziniae]MCU4317103.1 hypothetical protein [Acinetobacter bereziniae]
MNYFSIDESMELIKNEYTKNLFKEVHSSYAMGNYRSAVVMLWSVVITDLVLKLKELESIYNDPVAINILSDIQKEQIKDRKSSKWESHIIEKFHNQLKFLETPEVAQMQHLHQMRHVSAHPVIDEDDTLHTPSKAEVFALMQNSLEAILTKEALYSSRVLDLIFEDLDKVNDTLSEYNDVDNYFNKKYLKNMSQPILLKFLEKIWKFTFQIDNPEVNKNRNINSRILNIIYEKRKGGFLDFLSNKRKFISNISYQDELVENFLRFIVNKKVLLTYFDDSILPIIFNLTKDKFSLFEILRFNSPLEYMDYIKSNDYSFMPVPSFDVLFVECANTNLLNDFFKLCILGYAKSHSFKRADFRFKSLIQKYITFFSIDLLRLLIVEADKNSQVYGRNEAKQDHRIIIEKLLSLDREFDFSPFENFIRGNINFIKNFDSKSDAHLNQEVIEEG